MKGRDKVFAPLLRVPLIVHAVEPFEWCLQVDSIVLVLAGENLQRGRDLCRQRGWKKVVDICLGGPRRQDSVQLGLAALPLCQWVLIHDGARPCVDAEIIQRGLMQVHGTGAAVAAAPIKDTVKLVSPEGMVQNTLDRNRLWAVQTPQVFRRDLIERAHQEVREDVTDDATLVERLGIPVQVFMGSYANIKVTTPEDLLLAETLLSQRGEQ